ncbi:MAG: ribosome silencing factor [Filifactoraceae bacterium]
MKTRLEVICEAIGEKQGEDVTVLKVGTVTSLANYFVIASADNDKKLQAIAGNIEDELEKIGVFCIAKEGQRSDSWIILDYGDIMVHLFKDEFRTYYDLERLWKDAPKVSLEKLSLEEV